MPNANWSNPTLTSTYTNFVTEVKNRDEDLALQFDGTTSTNIPTNTIRWDSSANRWKKWNGSSWVELTGTYALTALTTTGSVGIGTTTPRGLVSIANNAAGTGVVDSSLHFGYSISDYYGHRIVNSNEPTSTAAGLLRFQRGTTAAWVDSVTIDTFGRVGIGSSSPDSALYVVAGSVARLRIGYNNTSFNYYDADTQIFRAVDGTERLRIDSNGRVGIGTGAPSYLLHANTSAAADVELAVQNSAGLARYGTRTSGNAFAGSFTAGKAFELWSANAQAVTIDSSGRVGIGTSSPWTSGVLDCFGNAKFGASSTNGLYLGIVSGTPYIQGYNSATPSSSALAFYGGTSEAMRIDSNGRVGIGTISPAASLDIAGNQLFSAANPQIQFNAGGPIIRVPSGNTLAFLSDSTTERLRIGSSGQLGLGGANYGTDGQVLTSAGASAAPTWARPSAITAGTSVASTSGTSIDFTSIPSWVKRVTVMFDGVGTSSTSLKLLQLGDSGGIETTGYASSAGTDASRFATSTSGFVLSHAFNSSNAETMFGAIVLTNVASNTWVAQGAFHMPTYTVGNYVAGGKALSGTLDRVRITTVNGTDTFDAGSINILWEG